MPDFFHYDLPSVDPDVAKLIDYEKFCNTFIRDRDLDFENKHTINHTELREKIKQSQPVRLIDLRDPVELQIMKIPEAENATDAVRLHFGERSRPERRPHRPQSDVGPP